MYRITFNDAVEVGEKKAGKEGWRGFSCEVAIGGFVITGSSKPDTDIEDAEKVVVTEEEMEAAAEKYEAGGKCWDCKGSGSVFAGWHYKEGTTYETCGKCRGSGNA